MAFVNLLSISPSGVWQPHTTPPIMIPKAEGQPEAPPPHSHLPPSLLLSLLATCWHSLVLFSLL